MAIGHDARHKAVMKLTEFTIDSDHLRADAQGWDRPLALVDLQQARTLPDAIALPPCPVIGIGDASHPLACKLDALVDDAPAVALLAAQITAQPHAAAVVVQLLRILPDLSPDAGLTVESLAFAMLQASAGHREWLAGRAQASHAASARGAVRLERDGALLTITLDRPAAGNAIDRTMRDALHEALELASLDPEIERVVLRANGKAFSLGADLGEFGSTTDPAMAHAIRMQTLPARQAIRCAAKLDAHVQGACIGAGLELAGFAQNITATRNAWFQLPELAMGILPGAGGCVSLTRRIGRQRTALMILSGRRLNARTALDWGLVDAVVDDPA